MNTRPQADAGRSDGSWRRQDQATDQAQAPVHQLAGGGEHQQPTSQHGLPDLATGRVWYYKDPEGATRGPFTQDSLLEFVTTGYFSDKLPVSRATASRVPSSEDQWIPLGEALRATQNTNSNQAGDGAGKPQAQHDETISSQQSRFGFAVDAAGAVQHAGGQQPAITEESNDP
eukprot:COSAG06_NODE_30070_length_545_cov_1.022422_1_plen_172_part_01